MCVSTYERGGGGLKNVFRFVMCVPVDNMVIIQLGTYIRHLTEYQRLRSIYCLVENTLGRRVWHRDHRS